MALNIGTEQQKSLFVFPFGFNVEQNMHVDGKTLEILKLHMMNKVDG